MRRFSSVALFLSLVAACRSDNNNPGTDGSNGSGDGSNPGGTTIQMVQSDAMAPGTPVDLHGKIVTAIDTFGAKTGAFWIEEPGGGTFSGVQVFNADPNQVAQIAVGDIVDVTGAQKSEFALSTDTSGNTDTELEPVNGGTMTVTKTGTGTVPAPVVVDALAIGQSSSDADCRTSPTTCPRNTMWEQYEGVLITVNNVSALNSAKSFGSGNVDQASFTITGAAVVESTLAALPGEGSGMNDPGTVLRGDCLGNVTGVLDYFFTYNLLPRNAGDITTNGAGCPPAEQANGAQIGTCGDGTDNDGNGFSDCADLGCEVGSAAWLDPSNCNHAADGVCGCSTNLKATTGVDEVDTAASGAVGPVILNNVIVTAVGSKGFWVADKLQAAQNGGVFIFTGSAPTITTADIGKTVDTVQGIAGPFTASGSPTGAVPLTEVGNATAGTASGAGVPLPIANPAVATVFDVNNGKPFAGSLISLQKIKVVTAPVNGKGKATVSDGTTQFTMNDFAFGGGAGGYTGATTTVNTCYGTLVGVVDFDTKNQVRTINPRSVADMVVGAGCP